MKFLCYGTFAKMLLWGISKPKFQTKLHVLLLSMLEEEYANLKVDPAHASRWFNCRDDVTSALRETAMTLDTHEVSARFYKHIIPLINPNKLPIMISAICKTILDDEHINPKTVIDSINNIKKEDLHKPINDTAGFIVGVFMYAVIYTENKRGRPFSLTVMDFLYDFEYKAQIEADNEKVDIDTHNIKIANFSSNAKNDTKDTRHTVEQFQPKAKKLPLKALGSLLLAVIMAAMLMTIIFNRPRVVSAAAGTNHSLALRDDGTLWAWGRNEHGQLGDGTLLDRYAPVYVMDSVTYIAAGIHFSFAIKDDGTLWAWGQNDFGQLGDGTTVMRNTPVKIMENVQHVASGWGHTMVLDNTGVLWAWGYNAFGQIGDGTRVVRYLPTIIMEDVVYISAGQDHSLAIMSDNSLWSWGNNISGQLGDGTTDTQHKPVLVLHDVRYVSGGAQHTMAIRVDGSLYTWGRNLEGQLGNSGTTTQHYPTRIMDSASRVAAGGLHSMAISEKQLWVWGSNTTGQIGIGDDIMSVLEPVQISGSIYSIAASRSNGFSLAINRRGNLYAWGDNEFGQLGNGTSLDQPIPIEISIPRTTNSNAIIVQSQAMAAAGYTHSFALTEEATLWAWGGNHYGQLGDGTNVNRGIPINILESVAYIAAGYGHSLAIKTDGSLWAWGENTQGQLGDGTMDSRNIPVRIMESVVAASAGSFHSLALDIDGNVWAWGTNHWGELGIAVADYDIETWRQPVIVMESARHVAAGDTFSMAIDNEGYLWVWGYWPWCMYANDGLDENLAPRAVMGGVSYVCAGFNHAMLIKTDGSLWAWGSNEFGQLGDGTTKDRDEPVQILEHSVISVSAGDTHTAAVLFLRTGERILRVWGRNDYGQLGDGTRINSNTPIWAMSPVLSVSTGGNHTLAIAPDGSIWAWGCNEYGQIGAAYTNYIVPYMVINEDITHIVGNFVTEESTNETLLFGDYNGTHPCTVNTDAFVSVSSGRSHTMGLDAEGNLWAWGHGGFGRLGDGATTSRDEPVFIMDSVTAISAGRYHSAVIRYDDSLWMWGRNTEGQLGDGTRSNALEPTQIMDNVKAVALGGYHTVAVDQNGTVWTWGNNDFGQIGNGSVLRQSLPTSILENIVFVSAGLHHSMAIDMFNNLWVWGCGDYMQFVNDFHRFYMNPMNISLT